MAAFYRSSTATLHMLCFFSSIPRARRLDLRLVKTYISSVRLPSITLGPAVDPGDSEPKDLGRLGG
jgi:hypothetical protein